MMDSGGKLGLIGRDPWMEAAQPPPVSYSTEIREEPPGEIPITLRARRPPSGSADSLPPFPLRPSPRPTAGYRASLVLSQVGCCLAAGLGLAGDQGRRRMRWGHLFSHCSPVLVPGRMCPPAEGPAPRSPPHDTVLGSWSRALSPALGPRPVTGPGVEL